MTAAKHALRPDMSWILDPLLVVKGVRHGVVLSADGMVTGASPGLSREAGEGASAMMSALQGAARSLARELSGDPRTTVEQVVVATDKGFVFAVPAGPDTVLALFADHGCDMETLSHRVQLQVAALGEKAVHTPSYDRGAAS
ncbi:roadblock/LC7 domain-containing protein [Streptomyces palmae]|uniref:Roadblock/LC7 domain-containing protein n=1 Tax=Streptomyces palmae TaxID=1701085 RepID=A0A4Z0H0I1_9ACTN|nr:roadblock/LC7 domain-containing protein [Streptomyces palmae]TGB03175.1 roadblock/LC7 domain-containing protein [Streptomyces palmae]